MSSTPERADLGQLGSVLNRGEAGGEEQRGGMGRAPLLHNTLSFTKTDAQALTEDEMVSH